MNRKTDFPRTFGAGLDVLESHARHGQVRAQRRLGELLLEASPGAENPRAISWLTASAGHGDRIAMRRLGICHRYGEGCAVDLSAAERWLSLAGEAGDAEACMLLAGFYQEDDLKDRPQDFVRAVHWYKRAAALNHPETEIVLQDTGAALAVYLERTSGGWVQVILDAGEQAVILRASDVFDPFYSFLGLMQSVRHGPLPGGFVMDEEEVEKRIEVTEDDGEVRLVVRDEDYPGEPGETIYIDLTLPRRDLLVAFCEPFADYFQRRFDPSEWRDHVLVQNCTAIGRAFARLIEGI